MLIGCTSWQTQRLQGYAIVCAAVGWGWQVIFLMTSFMIGVSDSRQPHFGSWLLTSAITGCFTSFTTILTVQVKSGCSLPLIVASFCHSTGNNNWQLQFIDPKVPIVASIAVAASMTSLTVNVISFTATKLRVRSDLNMVVAARAFSPKLLIAIGYMVVTTYEAISRESETERFAVTFAMDVLLAAVAWSGVYLNCLIERQLTWTNILDLTMTLGESTAGALLCTLAVLCIVQLSSPESLHPVSFIPIVYFVLLGNLFLISKSPTELVRRRKEMHDERTRAGDNNPLIGTVMLASAAGNLDFGDGKARQSQQAHWSQRQLHLTGGMSMDDFKNHNLKKEVGHHKHEHHDRTNVDGSANNPTHSGPTQRKQEEKEEQMAKGTEAERIVGLGTISSSRISVI
jgi:hypothetical protein